MAGKPGRSGRRPFAGEFKATLRRKRQRLVVAMIDEQQAGRREVGMRRLGVVRPVEMLGPHRPHTRASYQSAARQCSSRRRLLSRPS